MRTALVSAALVSFFLSSAVAIGADEPKMAKMAGVQTHVMSIDSATLDIPKMPHTLKMTVHAKVRSTGWKNGALLPRIYIHPPADGIYEVDVVADKPSGIVSPVTLPMIIEHLWKGYPEAHLKGVKFISETNSVTAMLPPVKP